jgi:hypothetical protein
MKEEWEANIDVKSKDIIVKLEKTLGKQPATVDEEEKLFNTLKGKKFTFFL